ncbi:MAG: hypothetical protein Kow00121_03910 [Elainellaceae cyanobacterium]
MDCPSQQKREQDAKFCQPDASTFKVDTSEMVPHSLNSKSTLPRSIAGLGNSAQESQPLAHNLTQTILTSNSANDALKTFAQAIGNAFSADCCLIVPEYGKSIASQIIYWCNASRFPACSADDFTQFLSHSLIQPPLLAKEPLTICDFQSLVGAESLVEDSVTSGKEPIVPSLNLQNVKAVLAIAVQGKVNGMVMVMRSQPYAWKESDVHLLQSLSPQMAIAISQLNLEQQVQQQNRYQNLSSQLTIAIRHGWELDRIFQLATEGTASALQVDRSMVLLLKYTDPLHRGRFAQGTPQAKVQVAAEWSGLAGAQVASHAAPQTFWASDCKLCQQMLKGAVEPIVLPASNTAYNNHLQALLTNHETAPIFALDAFPALILAPLENQGTILGCVVLQHHQHRTWSIEEINFISLAAAQLSTAIIQTRTMQQIQAVVQERTAQLERSLEVQAKLYEKMRQQLDQLRQLNAEREEFLSTVSHELRTPLTSMTLAIRMLRQTDLPADRRTKYLDILEQQCTQETQLINDLLALRQLEHCSAAQLQKIDTQHFIQNLAQAIQPSLAETDLKLELDLPSAPLPLYTEPESLNRILTELLTNAKKYSYPESSVHLQVTHKANASVSEVVFTLKNIGSGILPEELPHIFDKFRRGRGVTQQAIQGTGLGLALVKGLVEHLGGAIAVFSHPLDTDSAWQTCFTVTLPQCPEGAIQAIC